MVPAEFGDGDGAAEGVSTVDCSVGSLGQVQGGVSPGEGEREVTLASLTGHPGPAARGQVRPELERDDLGRDLSTSGLDPGRQEGRHHHRHHHHRKR